MTRADAHEMPLFVSRETAARRCEVSVDTFDQLVREGYPDLTPCPGCLGSGEFRSCIDGECAHANLGCPDCAQTCPLCGGMGRV